MDEATLRQLLTCLGPSAFDRLIASFFGASAPTSFTGLPQAGPNVFFEPILDSYGGSLHSVFVIHHSPADLFRTFSRAFVADSELKHRIARVWELYKGETGAWGMVSPFLKTDRKLQTFAIITNLSGFSRDVYEDEIIPSYASIAKRLRLRPGRFLVGSYDSFIDLNLDGIRRALTEFIRNDAAELSIELSSRGPTVRRVAAERHFSTGVLSVETGPLEPIFELHRDEAVLTEFEDLLRRSVSEGQLERFLVANYRLIFGPQYDRVETQLWARFPDLDIAGRDRRFDVLLRNSNTRDWEIHELKRSNARLTAGVRDVPRFASAVIGGIQQLRNYGRILGQDIVKRRFAQEGIEYFEPELRLVVGGPPEVSHDKWRSLVKACPDVKVTTYDELLGETKRRILQRRSLMKGFHQRFSDSGE